MVYLENASFIKSILIDSLIAKKQNVIFGSEVQFSKKGNYVDLLYLKNDQIFVFEIKAAMNDNLRKLPGQLETYKKVFNYVNIVITENHLDMTKMLISGREGIILIKPNGKLVTLGKKANRH